MADVKTLTVHGIPYSIKDETARNNYNTLNSTVTQQGSKIAVLEDDVDSNTKDITTLKSTVSGHTSSISQINSKIESVNSDVSDLEPKVTANTQSISQLNDKVETNTNSISSINGTLGTKVTGDWFFDQYVSQSDTHVPQTPSFADLYTGTFGNTAGGYYLVTVTGLLFQGGQGNIEIFIEIDGSQTLIGNVPANENLFYANCTGVVSFPAGNHSVKIKARATNASAVAKAYSSIFVTLVKIKNV